MLKTVKVKYSHLHVLVVIYNSVWGVIHTNTQRKKQKGMKCMEDHTALITAIVLLFVSKWLCQNSKEKWIEQRKHGEDTNWSTKPEEKTPQKGRVKK